MNENNNKNEIFYSSKILNDSLNGLIIELNESMKSNINKEYFISIELFILNVKQIVESMNNKIKVEKIIFDELKESIDYKLITSEDKISKKSIINNIINKYIGFQYEIMKDCLYVLKNFSQINIDFYKKYKQDFMFKIIGINNAIDLANINILGYIEFIEDLDLKKIHENKAWCIMSEFLKYYEPYK